MVEFKRKISQELVNDELHKDPVFWVDWTKITNLEVKQTEVNWEGFECF